MKVVYSTIAINTGMIPGEGGGDPNKYDGNDHRNC